MKLLKYPKIQIKKKFRKSAGKFKNRPQFL